jgi:hypothetical protein
VLTGVIGKLTGSSSSSRSSYGLILLHLCLQHTTEDMEALNAFVPASSADEVISHVEGKSYITSTNFNEPNTYNLNIVSLVTVLLNVVI